MIGLTLVAGVVAALAVIVHSTGGAVNVAPDPDGPAVDVAPERKPDKTIPPEARRVAGRFILTAAMREHLDQAWPLAGPDVRQGTSYRDWLRGNIAVGRVFGPIKRAPMSVDAATKRWALLKIIVVPEGENTKPGIFTMRLDRIGKRNTKHWVVNEFQQWASPSIPADTAHN